MHAYDDNLGFDLEACKRFSVMLAWGISQSHSDRGKFGSVPAKPDFR